MLLLSSCFDSSVHGQDVLPLQAPEGMKVQQPKDPALMYLKRHLNLRRGLIKRVCQLSEIDVKNLDSVGEDWIKLELPKGAAKQDGILKQGLPLFFRGAPGQIAGNDPVKIRKIQSLLDKKLTDDLSQEQREQVQTAIEESERFECEANAQVLVSLMDKRFILTADQRESLELKIASWLKGKSLYMEHYTLQNNYLPDIPASVVENVLTSDQRMRFKAINKITFDRLGTELQMLQHQQPLAEQDY